jgi:hypothetical protein
MRRRSKYGNVKVEADGYTFDSKAEYRRYQELKLLDKAKDIFYLQVHPEWNIIINGEQVCRYKADFSYQDARRNQIVEDVKGVKTQVYQLKKKLMKVVLGIDIVEVK